jgi:hypothetical protein
LTDKFEVIMNHMLSLHLDPPGRTIRYGNGILLVGSCFTEHLGNKLQELKFKVLQNPNGILFDPLSVADSLNSYIERRTYSEKDLFEWNELWQSWRHHSEFSQVSARSCLERINASQNSAHEFLKTADWLIITLGSSFSYRLTGEAISSSGIGTEQGVANCHRAPAKWFRKHLMTAEETTACLDNTIYRLFQFNPQIRIILTVSPVRHIRDGVVENNRSKARLIEAVHTLVDKFDHLHYFPAYEMVIDVLRDYRYYDIDLVHPNYQATGYVWEQFSRTYLDEESRLVAEEVKKLVIARKHKAFHPETNAHKEFLNSSLIKVEQLQSRYPFLDLSGEIRYFSGEEF